MAERSQQLQDHYLNLVRRSHLPVTIFLVKGVKLQGVVAGFDAFSIQLRRDGNSQLVYKHSISTIMPAAALDGLGGGEGGGNGKAVLQDRFIAAASKQKERMTIFLVNGVMLQGQVTGFDQFSLLLERGGLAQLVYKHAISTLQPAREVALEPAMAEAEADPGEL
jgi:host factor-I protein